jgi:hypothetical protein
VGQLLLSCLVGGCDRLLSQRNGFEASRANHARHCKTGRHRARCVYMSSRTQPSSQAFYHTSHSGGLNFDCKLRRESTDIEDMFVAHVASMDMMARALLCAADILRDGELGELVKTRYSSWESDLGRRVEADEATFEEMEAAAEAEGEPALLSAKQEKYEAILNMYC